MSQHEHFHFSVTIKSEELFMVSAMRRLARQCQPQINRQIAVAGTNNAKWKRNQGNATFYFTNSANRTEFLSEMSLIFPTGWKKVSHDEKRIAPRQISN
jgi:tRNA G46 methylase TrmB